MLLSLTPRALQLYGEFQSSSTFFSYKYIYLCIDIYFYIIVMQHSLMLYFSEPLWDSQQEAHNVPRAGSQDLFESYENEALNSPGSVLA